MGVPNEEVGEGYGYHESVDNVRIGQHAHSANAVLM